MHKEKNGYEYILSLCCAIDTVIDNERRMNPGILIYDNIDFGTALKKRLYSTYANNQSLMDIFSHWRSGQLTTPIESRDDVGRKLIASMCNLSISQIVIATKTSPVRIAIKEIVRLVIAVLFIDKFSLVTRKIINKYINRYQKNSVLFYVPNIRFAKFILPVFRETNHHLYITPDKNTFEYLKISGYPVKRINNFLITMNRWTLKESWLKRFNLIEQYLLCRDLIMHLKPRAIVLIEGNAADDEILNEISKKTGIKTICIQQGWSPIVHNGFRELTFSKMLVWGEGFADCLRSYNPLQNFISTGSFSIEKSKINKQPEIIRNITFFLQTNTHVFTAILSKRIFYEFIDLIKWTATNHPNIRVIIREHPVDYFTEKERCELGLKDIKNITYLNSDSCSLEEVMKLSDISVSVYSSTILESIASGVLPIIFNPSMPNFYPDVSKYKAAIEVKNLSLAKKCIADIIKNPRIIREHSEGIDVFKNKFFVGNKHQAIHYIVNEINKE